MSKINKLGKVMLGASAILAGGKEIIKNQCESNSRNNDSVSREEFEILKQSVVELRAEISELKKK